MSKNRTCKVCGEKYYYCFNHTCDDNQPSYMALFHDENCKTIFETLNKLYFKQLSTKDAVKILKSCDLSALEKETADMKIKEKVQSLVTKKSSKRNEQIEAVESSNLEELVAEFVKEVSEEMSDEKSE